MSTFKIYPLYLGHSEQDLSFALARAPLGKEKVWFAYGCFAAVNNQTGAITMLDTGCRHWSEVEKYGLPWTTNVEKSDRLADAMHKIGLRPEDVSRIILTHLHHDHCANLEIFPKSVPIYVQRAELAAACAPFPSQRYDYTVLDYPGCPYWKDHISQFVGVDGDLDLEPGLQLLFTPGHTEGSQSVLMDTEKGPYLYAGDMYYCQKNLDEGFPHGNLVSLRDWHKSHLRIRATGAVPLSLHMMHTFDVRCYG